MKNKAGILLIFLILSVLVTTGCTSPAPSPSPVQTPSPAPPTPTPAITTVTTSPIIPATPTPTPTMTFVSLTTPPPKADPADVSEITFLQYSNGDFSVDYPSTWTIASSRYTPYPVGPFYLYDDPRLNTPYRVVTFTSPDATKKFVSLTQDFSQDGMFVLNPTIDWARGMFEKNYPDLSAVNYVGNYKYFSSGNTMASTYDAILPKGSSYYPSAYSVKTVITTRRVYNFGFFTDSDTFATYKNLDERMISSVQANDAG
jgi:hypothetical protein